MAQHGTSAGAVTATAAQTAKSRTENCLVLACHSNSHSFSLSLGDSLDKNAERQLNLVEAWAALHTMLWLPAVAARALGFLNDGQHTVAVIIDPVVPVVGQLVTLLLLLDDNELNDNLARTLALDNLGVAAIAAVPVAGLAVGVLILLTAVVGLGRVVALAVEADLSCSSSRIDSHGSRRRQ